MGTQISEPADSVATTLAEFIVEDLDWDGSKEELLSDQPVDLPAILDSTDLMELAGFLEDEFGVVIDDEEIVAETFASVRQLALFVVTKQAGVPAGS